MLKSILDNKYSEHHAKQLEFYKSEGVGKLRVLLKAEGLKNCSNRYHEMNLKKSLKANLSAKIIIEYPTLVVVLNHSAGEFETVPSDGEKP
jgi:hypothetical protein